MSFGQLFRASKLSSTLPRQVILESKVFKGEFGLKHGLEAVHSTIVVDALDDPRLNKPKVKSAWHQLALGQVWKENFVLSETPSNARQAALEALPSAPLDHYQTLLSKARASKETFGQLIKNRKIAIDDWQAFLGIRDQDASVESVHPPTYLVKTLDKVQKVKGRILNTVNGGFAVGIAGIVAYLPQNEANIDDLVRQNGQKKEFKRLTMTSSKSTSIDRESVFDFYVLSAKHDAQGRPEIILSMHPPVNTNTKPSRMDKGSSHSAINILRNLKQRQKQS